MTIEIVRKEWGLIRKPDLLVDLKNGTKCTPIFTARAMEELSSEAPLNDLRSVPR
jgi:hypothetical protein